VLGLKSAHGLRRGPRAVARQPATRPNSHTARPAPARHGVRAPPVVTVRWPRAWRRAGTADGIEPGDQVRGIQRGQPRRRGTAGSGPAVTRVGGARVRTMAGGSGSLTSGAQMATGGRGAHVGQPGTEMEWAEPV
jgi:hypothetical protein